jgi:hypothetical protein
VAEDVQVEAMVVREHVQELAQVPVVHLLGRPTVEDDRALGGAEGLVERLVERLGRQDRRALGRARAPTAAALLGERLAVFPVAEVADRMRAWSRTSAAYS